MFWRLSGIGLIFTGIIVILIPTWGMTAQDDTAVTPLTALQVFAGPLDAVAFSPDGTLLASGGRDNNVRLWNVETGENQAVLAAHTDWVTSVTFSPDGTILASGARDNTIRLWDVISWELLQTIEQHTDDVTGLAFTPDGTVLASGSRDGRIQMIHLETGQHIAELENFGGPVWDIAFSPDGTTLASASEDGTIWLIGVWDEAGVWLTPLRGHESPVVSVVFSPNGESLLSGGQDGTLRLWDIRNARFAESFEPVVMRGHLAPVMGVGFTADTEVAISASLDGTVRLWDVAGVIETGKELATITGQGTPLTNLTLNKARTVATSVGTDGVMRLWDVDTDTLAVVIKSQRPAVIVQSPKQEAAPVKATAVAAAPTIVPQSAPPQTVPQPTPPAPTAIPQIAPQQPERANGPLLTIPSANIRSAITTFHLDGISWGIDPWETLVGHLQGTAWFTVSGNTVLAGHSEYPNGTPGIFAGLYNVKQGDEIIVQDSTESRRYVVVDIRTVHYDDLSVVYPTDHRRLTLITCDIPSFHAEANFYAERLVVIADAIG